MLSPADGNKSQLDITLSPHLHMPSNLPILKHKIKNTTVWQVEMVKASTETTAVLPAVWCRDQVSGCEQPVQQIQAGSLLAGDQCFTLAFLPTVTVCCGGGPLQPGKEQKQI